MTDCCFYSASASQPLYCKSVVQVLQSNYQQSAVSVAAGRKQFTAVRTRTKAGSPVLNPACSRSATEVGRVSPPRSSFVLRVRTIVLETSLCGRLLCGIQTTGREAGCSPASLPAGREARLGFPTFSPHLLPAGVAGGHCSLVNPAAPAGPIAAGLQGAPQPATLSPTLSCRPARHQHNTDFPQAPLDPAASRLPACQANRQGRNPADIY